VITPLTPGPVSGGQRHTAHHEPAAPPPRYTGSGPTGDVRPGVHRGRATHTREAVALSARASSVNGPISSRGVTCAGDDFRCLMSASTGTPGTDGAGRRSCRPVPGWSRP
jgi:hypothetical protein